MSGTATHGGGHCFGFTSYLGDNSSCTVSATDSFKIFCLTPAASQCKL
jgi:hypothetical protein